MISPDKIPLVEEGGNEGNQGVAADAAALAPSGLSPSGSQAEPPAANADRACQATDPAILRDQIMDCRVPKNEREWWAARTIEQLVEALELADAMLRGAHMDCKVVERKVTAAIARATGVA